MVIAKVVPLGKVKHPATWTPALLDRIAAILGYECETTGRRVVVLDNHAGTGVKVSDHLGLQLCSDWLGVEIEPEWAAVSPWVHQGDSDHLPPGWKESFGALVTSPDYGTRMADHHDAKDGTERKSYTHDLRATTGDSERHLDAANTGTRLFGPAYQAIHVRRLIEAIRCVRPGGLVIINMSDHIKAGRIVHVVAWWRETMLRAGLVAEHDWIITTPRMKMGENRDLRVDGEHLLVFRRPEMNVVHYLVAVTELRIGEVTEDVGRVRSITAGSIKTADGKKRVGRIIEGEQGRLEVLKAEEIRCLSHYR